jgi:putative DNA primase/helicase
VEKYSDHKVEARFLELRRKLKRWGMDHGDSAAERAPNIPVALHDRAADNWRPLLAIADEVGGAWPTRARDAAVWLQATVSAESVDHGVLLLKDMRDIFREHAGAGTPHAGRLASEFLVNRLGEMEERPWPEWRWKQPMTVTQLAEALQPFGIGPKKMRIGQRTVRGYNAAWFEDAFARYLAADPEQVEQEEQPYETGPRRGIEAAIVPEEGAER